MKLFGNSGKEKKKKGGSRLRFWMTFALASIIVVLTVGAFLKNVVFKLPDMDAGLSGILENPNNMPVFDVPEGGGGDEATLPGRKDRYYTFLLGGLDNDGTRTDVLMVVSFDVANKKINVVSVPRDTMANTDRALKKINGAYQKGKAEQTIEELSSIIGFRPDYYAIVDLKAFKQIVDKIGGIDFDVPQNMKYTDPDQDLYINLKKGMQHLDGEKAMQLVRFRSYPMGDIQRNKVQQDFLTAVAKKMVSITNIAKMPDFVKILFDNLKTSLTATQLTRLGIEALTVDIGEGLSFHSLPVIMGEHYKGADYVYVDKAAALEMVNELLNPYTARIADIDSLTVKNGKIISTKGSAAGKTDTKKGTAKATPEPAKKSEKTAKPTASAKPSPSQKPEVPSSPSEATPEPPDKGLSPNTDALDPIASPTVSEEPTVVTAPPIEDDAPQH